MVIALSIRSREVFDLIRSNNYESSHLLMIQINFDIGQIESEVVASFAL